MRLSSTTEQQRQILILPECRTHQCAGRSRGFTSKQRYRIALPMAVGLERRARKAASRLQQALHLHPGGQAMSDNPLSHTSGAGLHMTDRPILQSSAEYVDLDPSNQSQAASPSLLQHSNKKRRSSKSKIPAEIRRSSSTPHMRSLAITTSGELSPTADKRRNKLGYHRTSVACGKGDVYWVNEEGC